MKPIIIKPSNREEWLKAREGGIGASEVAAVIGCSPWETPFSLWLKKTGQVTPEPENRAMKMGRMLERVVVELWEEETGFKAVKASAKDIIYQDPEHPWRKVTPDRIAYEIDPDGKKKKVLVEAKTSRSSFDKDDLPTQYLCQVQYQMHVTGIHVCHLCWLASGIDFGYARIEYDKEFADWMVEKVDSFWNRCIIGGEEPECVSVPDYVFKGSEPGKTIDADDVAFEQVKQLFERNRSIAQETEIAEGLKDQIKLYMGEAESLVKDGKTLATWKTGTRGRTFLMKNKNIEELLENNENGT